MMALAARVLLAVALAGCVGAVARGAEKSLALGGSARWKYMAFDPVAQELFIAQGDGITVVDTAAMRIRGYVAGVTGARGVALVPGGRGYASSGKSASLSVFDRATLRVTRALGAGDDANSVTYDPFSKRVFVANDDAGTVTAIDVSSDTVVGTIRLAGGEGLDSAVPDGRGHIFISHSARHELVRIDTRAAKADAAWPLAGCDGPRGLAADAASQRLFASCADGHLLVLDEHDGRLVARLPIGTGGASVLFDARRHRIYVSDADGTISVVEQVSADGYAPGRPIASPRGARTAALNPVTGAIYLVAADVDAARGGGTRVSRRVRRGWWWWIQLGGDEI